MDAIRVTVRRGQTVEARHRVHIRSTHGDAAGEDVYCFMRSSLKPIQAVPLVESYDDVSDEEIAVACASHQAEPDQLAAVRRLLERAGAGIDDLECGTQAGRPEGPLAHNCSGKHAGMLAVSRAHGFPMHSYRDPAHPVQRWIAALVDSPELAIDGCGVPTFAMPLTRMSQLFASVLPRIAEAMRRRPDLVGGTGADDTDLMLAMPGWTAKRGAEGLFCAVSPDGVGWAFKAEDGASRALRPAIGQVLRLDAFRTVPLRNSRGDVVGSIE
jgi:L-asparaginase II